MKLDYCINLLIFTLLSSFLLEPCHGVEEAQLVEVLITSDDGWTNPDEIKALSIKSIDSILTVLEGAATNYESKRAINLVSLKYVQYKSQLTVADRDNIVNAIINSIDKNERLLSSPFVRDSLISMNHSGLHRMAQKYQDHQDKKISQNAKQIVSKYSYPDQSQVTEASINSDSTLRGGESMPLELIIEEDVTAEPTLEAPEESTNWLLWLIGALVVLGGIALVVRRKN